jgi:hypothetical protein
MNGKIIFPKKLKIKRKFIFGIVGTGKMAYQHARVIKSFGHSVGAVFSRSNGRYAKIFSQKQKAPLIKNLSEVLKDKINLDGWIICGKWNNLYKDLLFFLKQDKPVLIEKSIIVNISQINAIFRNYSKNKIKNIFIGYNRNYYDFIPYLVKKLKKEKIIYAEAFLADKYNQIIKNHGRSIIKSLPIYITSHWLNLILKVMELLGYRISKIKKIRLKKLNFFNSYKLSLVFKSKKKNKRVLFDIIHAPDLPANHKISFYSEKRVYNISPIEKLTINEKLKKNHGSYIPTTKHFACDNTYKPGLRYQYYDFIKKNFYKKKSILNTDMSQLLRLYKLCKFIS